jgi:hypothetical protein
VEALKRFHSSAIERFDGNAPTSVLAARRCPLSTAEAVNR